MRIGWRFGNRIGRTNHHIFVGGLEEEDLTIMEKKKKVLKWMEKHDALTVFVFAFCLFLYLILLVSLPEFCE